MGQFNWTFDVLRGAADHQILNTTFVMYLQRLKDTSHSQKYMKFIPESPRYFDVSSINH